MKDEELREFAKEQATALGMPEVAAGLTAAFFYVRAQTRLETFRSETVDWATPLREAIRVLGRWKP